MNATAPNLTDAAPEPQVPETTNEWQLTPEVELVLARFRWLARRRAAWLQKLWHEEGQPGGQPMVTYAEIATHLADRDSPEAEADWMRNNPELTAEREELEQIESAMAAIPESRLSQLGDIFGLCREDTDLLQACLAVACHPSLARVCGYLQDHAGRCYVTEELAARLFGYGRCGIWSSESPLFRWELVTARECGPGEPCALACDPAIRDWLLARPRLDAQLVGLARVRPYRKPLASWPVREIVEFLEQILRAENPGRARVALMGQRGSGRRSLAAAASSELDLPLLCLDVDQVEEHEWRRVFVRAQRHAYLYRCSLAWSGDSLSQRPWPECVPGFPVQFALLEPGQQLPPVSGLSERKLTVPAVGLDEREALWLEHLPAAAAWPRQALRSLAERYSITPYEIAAAARTGPASPEQAGQRVREAARLELGRLAQLLECPFSWDDLVVTATLREALEELEFEARHRAAFWEQAGARRLFPQGRGLMALFSGPPGTGKTMAAQVIAASLGYDLYRVNLAGIVSKWVGETSQNLDRLLTQATGRDVILVFDEADALFSRRVKELRDAQDKFANTDSAYLLQAIESYPGIALLTTNQRGNIDPAFLRRLRFVLEFPKPGAAQQLELWRKVVAGLTGNTQLEALSGTLSALAANIEATGAQIKNAVLGAIFLAQKEESALAARHLLRGLERELAKDGRSINATERDKVLNHGK